MAVLCETPYKIVGVLVWVGIKASRVKAAWIETITNDITPPKPEGHAPPRASNPRALPEMRA